MVECPASAAVSASRHPSGGRVGVLLPLPLGGTYDYRIPPGMALSEGDFVRVPFGARELAGVVWGPGSDAVGEDRLKDVLDRYDVPPLPPESRRFVHWVSAYTVHSLGSVLRMVMSIPEALQPPKPAFSYGMWVV